MSAHVRHLLYDTVTGDAPPAEAERILAHTTMCPSCAADLEAIREVIAAFPRPATPPSTARDEAFWKALANEVEGTLGSALPAPRSLPSILRNAVDAFVSVNRVRLLAGAGTLALATAVILLLWRETPVPNGSASPPEPVPAHIVAGIPVQEASLRMNNYLKKSRVLLVGITNMKTDGPGMDLSAERKQSRALLHEARFLRAQALDARSAKLIGDLDRILIELANIEERDDLPDVELIRTGIRRENLLFKIRMTENLMQAGYTERTPQ
jgi:hypothetical protein